MATIIKSNGEEVEVKPGNGKFFTLKQLKSFVGGYIEIVETNDGRLMVVNEEGKLNALPVNKEATLLYKYNSQECIADIIVGDVLVCKKSQIE